MNMLAAEPLARHVVGGVDTHKDTHVAAVVDAVGRMLGTASFANSGAGFDQLLDWMASFGVVDRVGVEGTGSYGAGLARRCRQRHVEVVEVCRVDRQRRRRNGKSDTADAQAAARAALAGDMVSTPKTGDGPVESMRMLRIPRNSAMKARTQVANQIHCLIDTAPEALRAQLKGRKIAAIVDEAARWRPGDSPDPLTVCRYAIRLLARRYQELSADIADIDKRLAVLVNDHAGELVAVFGVGVETASALLVAVGDNPERITTEAGLAGLCGVSPVDRSSGRQQHHSLNRGGNRDANRALWVIVFVRMRCHAPTRAYVTRRLAEGKTKRAIMRCLKRYVARELYPILTTTLSKQISPTQQPEIAA